MYRRNIVSENDIENPPKRINTSQIHKYHPDEEQINKSDDDTSTDEDIIDIFTSGDDEDIDEFLSTKRNKKKNIKSNKTIKLNKKLEQQEKNDLNERGTMILPFPHSSALTQTENSYLIVPSFATARIENPFFYLFGKVCRRFMYDNCPNNPNKCDLEHHFPEQQLFRKQLQKIGVAGTTAVYDTFILRSKNLFEFYFEDFVYYFSENHVHDKLRQMVSDCAIRKVPRFYKTIINGLIQSGFDYTNAVEILVQSIKYRSNTTSNAIVELILNPCNSEISRFLITLESLAEDKKYKFKSQFVNRMLIIYRETKNERLLSILSRIIDEKMTPKIQVDLLKLIKK